MNTDPYSKLLNYYRSAYLMGEYKLKKDISRIMIEKKCSREEAVKILYKEIFGEEFRASPPAERPKSLQESLEELKDIKRGFSGITYAILIMFFMLFGLSAITFNIGLVFLIWFLMLIIILLTGIIGKAKTVSWSYSEKMVLEAEISNLKEFIEKTIAELQAKVLEACDYSIQDNTLILKVSPSTTIIKTVVDRYGSRQIQEEADLGLLTIKAVFEQESGRTEVHLTYSAEVPLEYADYAASAYEKIIVGFKSSLRKTVYELKPKKVLVIDFAKIVEKLKETGVVIKAVKCPVCGGSVDLPEKGDIVKCPYCGTTLKAIDVYKLLKKILNI